ncbi:MAG: sugar phosphate isomerase/epimerase family protein, partial [Planctomycetota bacterium]
MFEVSDLSVAEFGSMRMNRRSFAASSAALAAALSVPRVQAADEATTKTARSGKHPICVFTKPFNSLTFDELADAIAEMGFDGIEAPIRRGGHIEAAQVKTELPKLVKALEQRGLSITVMTSDINAADHPDTEEILSVASDQGIERYRLGYLRYDKKKPIAPQLDAWSIQLAKLADLNERLGIRGVYQNHAGSYALGAPIWDLQRVLQGIDPQHLGVAYDIRHATVEGGTSWPLTFRMIQPHIDMVYVKDFRWKKTKVENVPLGDGLVQAEFFEMLAATG